MCLSHLRREISVENALAVKILQPSCNVQRQIDPYAP